MNEWDRQTDEPILWFRRYTALRLMPSPRSIAAVFREEMGGNERTEPPGRWYDQAKLWQWWERCAAFDEHQAKELEAQIAAEKKKILSEGYALTHERVKTLNILAKNLISDIALGRMYRKDVRSIGTGKDARQVNIEMFEEGLIREVRGCLADIASEMGERVKVTKQEITGANGKALLPDRDAILATLSDEEFELLKTLQTQALARAEQQQHGDSSTEENH